MLDVSRAMHEIKNDPCQHRAPSSGKSAHPALALEDHWRQRGRKNYQNGERVRDMTHGNITNSMCNNIAVNETTMSFRLWASNGDLSKCLPQMLERHEQLSVIICLLYYLAAKTGGDAIASVPMERHLFHPYQGGGSETRISGECEPFLPQDMTDTATGQKGPSGKYLRPVIHRLPPQSPRRLISRHRRRPIPREVHMNTELQAFPSRYRVWSLN